MDRAKNVASKLLENGYFKRWRKRWKEGGGTWKKLRFLQINDCDKEKTRESLRHSAALHRGKTAACTVHCTTYKPATLEAINSRSPLPFSPGILSLTANRPEVEPSLKIFTELNRNIILLADLLQETGWIL